MLNFLRTTQNCRRFVHAFVLFASLFHHVDHVDGREFDFALVHARPRRSVNRVF